jgi:hypothetical protein
MAKQLELILRPGKLARLERQHFGALHGTDTARDLGVRRREMVMPEQRHLLLEWALGMHHPEQPSLPGVVNAGIWRELAARRDANVRAVADSRVHVVGLLFEVDQVGGDGD